MKTAQVTLSGPPTDIDLQPLSDLQPQLVLVFGAVAPLTTPGLLERLKAAFPGAALAGCSTAGEIGAGGVSDGQIVVTALHFSDPGFGVVTTDLQSMDDSRGAGERLGQALLASAPHDVLVFGQGVAINGSALIEGLRAVLGPKTSVSGGLAGDGGAFQKTYTVSTQGISSTQIVAVGFHAPGLQLRHGSFHGWQPFGPARKVTRALGNVLFELDGEPALAVYKRYLGDYASQLPASGLLFPFEMLGEDHSTVGLIRTILGVDEDQGSLVLAGDILHNGYLRLMHASTDSLVDGASTAAERIQETGAAQGEALALLVSCVGRKLVMGARVDEEVEAVVDVFGDRSTVTGFYSNGEISPGLDGLDCKLHNQTMTITRITELV